MVTQAVDGEINPVDQDQHYKYDSRVETRIIQDESRAPCNARKEGYTPNTHNDGLISKEHRSQLRKCLLIKAGTIGGPK